MKNVLSRVVFAVTASAAVFAGSAAFMPGTAEAHCGGHDGTCGGAYQHTDGSGYCDTGGGNYNGIWYGYYCWWDTYCDAPQAGCSGAGCLDWPCDSCGGACYIGDCDFYPSGRCDG